MTLAQTKVRVFAFNRSTAEPVLSDAANITAKWAKDYGALAALTDVNPVEAEDGFYYFDLSAGERAVTIIGEIFPESATNGVQVIGVPAYFLAGNGSASGSGSVSETLTVTVNSLPADGVAVWVTTDIGGTNVVAGTLYTDAFGHVTFMLDAGTYYAWKQKAGVNFTNPESFTVV